MKLRECPFCGGCVRMTAKHTTVDYVETNAMCGCCLMKFSYVQNFSYSRMFRVARNASFEEAFNRRVVDDLTERMVGDEK